jgi:hypothetical protein
MCIGTLRIKLLQTFNIPINETDNDLILEKIRNTFNYEIILDSYSDFMKYIFRIYFENKLTKQELEYL